MFAVSENLRGRSADSIVPDNDIQRPKGDNLTSYLLTQEFRMGIFFRPPLRQTLKQNSSRKAALTAAGYPVTCNGREIAPIAK
jgi:hypothetical protein